MLAGLKIMLKITYKQMNDINRIKQKRTQGGWGRLSLVSWVTAIWKEPE